MAIWATIGGALARGCRVAGLGAAALAVGAALTQAQESPFSPALTVNGRVISVYELEQRALFFSLLEPDSDAMSAARKSLIDDRLRLQAAEAMDLKANPEAIRAGMEEFAARANMTAEQFLAEIGKRDVAPETYRDFVEAGVLWRDVVRARYLPQIRVSDAEVDRALAMGIASGGEIKYLLSEIILPTGGVVDAGVLAERIIGDVHSEAAFAAAARIHSKGPSAGRGGQLDWVEASKLPPSVAGVVTAMEPGTLSVPIAQPGSVMLLFLRDRSVSAGEAKGAPMVDLLRLPLAPGADPVAIAAGADRCEDLMPLFRGLPEEVATRQVLAEASLSGPLVAAVAGLDQGETAVVEGAELVMLCARVPASPVAPSREDVKNQLLNQKLGLRAMAQMEKLRAEALIVTP